MNATILSAGRRRKKAVILTGVRPGAKLSTAQKKSSDRYFFKSMAIALPCYTAALFCLAMHEQSGSAWWGPGFIASWVPVAAWLLKDLKDLKQKGGLK